MNTVRQLVVLCVVMLSAFPLLADKVMLVAGGGDKPGNAPATEVQLVMPFGVSFDQKGILYFVEMTGGERVRRINKKGILTTIAGTGGKGYFGNGGPARMAQFNGIHGLVVAPNGDIYLADTWNNCVRKIDGKTSSISTVAGTGKKGFGGDGGPATNALFGGIYSVAFDSKGENLYLADLDNRRVRTVNLKSGLVRTVAGNGEKGAPVEGADAVQSPLVDPRAVAVDSRGVIFILERNANVLRAVGLNGRIRTVAGTGQKGLSGDDGDALRATLNGPKHLCFDAEENVIIADTENHVIRKYLPRTGKIVRVAGSGKKGADGVGGLPLLLELNQPHGIYWHSSGELYIAD
ncbi:MAG: hypothetical protein H7X97_01900, partial [Opitutaceae bacterium]|nr:hypothetical protein [Verrucomicrobiales bacterium]